jgi:photosystem II stability/assembly factor-like uncharacterized protein
MGVAGTGAAAPPAAWQPIGPPDSSTVSCLAVAPSDPSVVYACVIGAGVQRSNDGGATWQPAGRGLDSPLVNGIAVDPTDPAVVYAATQTGLSRSTNGGATWRTSGPVNGLKSHAVVVDPAQPRVLFLGTAMGIFRSDNGGAAWQQQTDGLIPAIRYNFEVLALAIDPVHPRTVYAAHIGIHNGIHKTVNGGRIWFPLRRVTVDTLAVDPVSDTTVWAAGDAGIFRSADGGLTFEKVRAEPAHTLLVDPFDHTRLYAANQQDLQVSADGGQSWQTLAPGALPGGGALALAADPRAPGALLAATFGAGVYRSADGGQTWSASGAGLVNTPVQAVVVDSADGALFAAGPAGIDRSFDGGATWQRLPVSNLGTFAALAGAPSDPRTLYAALTAPSQIVRSTEGGGNAWQVVASLAASSLAVSLTDPSTVFAATAGGLMRSTDGGATWTTVFPNPVETVMADPLDPAVLYLMTGTELARSQDGGTTWTPLLHNGFLLGTMAIGHDAPRTILTSDSQSVLGSFDGGRTWSVLLTGCLLPYGLAVDPPSAGTLYVGCNQGVLQSTDAGHTWHRFSRGLYARSFNELLFDPADPQRLYAATGSAGVFAYDFPP